MHADINPQPETVVPRGDGRFPRSWLTVWLLAVLFCLIAALHFGSAPSAIVTGAGQVNGQVIAMTAAAGRQGS